MNSLVTLFHVIITRTGTDLIFLSRLGSTICFTNFGSHDPIVLYWNPWYTEPCYKGSLLYLFWPLGDVTGMLNLLFSNSYQRYISLAFWVKLPSINTSSGNDFLPSGNKPLPVPILTQLYHV